MKGVMYRTISSALMICRLELELRGSRLSGSHCARETAGAHVLLGGWEQRMLRGLHKGRVSHNKPHEIVSPVFPNLSCCDKCVKTIEGILEAGEAWIRVDSTVPPSQVLKKVGGRPESLCRK